MISRAALETGVGLAENETFVRWRYFTRLIIARLVCAALRSDRAERGILVCGTGVGACIAANKIPGIRAALCHDTYSAHQGVEHDDVNLLCIGAWIAGIRVAEEILQAFLSAEFSTAEEFRRRVRKLAILEQEAASYAGSADG